MVFNLSGVGKSDVSFHELHKFRVTYFLFPCLEQRFEKDRERYKRSRERLVQLNKSTWLHKPQETADECGLTAADPKMA